jgi:predicted transposase/invertase (TIGR01784 family)
MILEKEEYFPLIDDLSIHYIELPKFDDQKDIEYMEAVELWLTFIKRAGDPKSRERLNKLVERSEALKMAKEILEQISADEKLRQEYYAREKARLDAISRIKYAETKGMEKAKLEIAKSALKEGVEIDVIVKLTGFSEEKIEKIKNELESKKDILQ